VPRRSLLAHIVSNRNAFLSFASPPRWKGSRRSSRCWPRPRVRRGQRPPGLGERLPTRLPAVKGNQSGIHHDVDSPYYDATNPEECYADAADAENAGYRPPKQ
jgi:hypothetical protein